MTQQEIMTIALRQSAADCSCSETDFLRKENVITESLPSPDARKYLKLPLICELVSYGTNLVASCRKDLIPEVTAFVNGAEDAYRCFETPAIYELNRILEKADARVCYMADYFLPEPDSVFRREPPCPYETRELHREDFEALYLPQWSNALCRDRKHLDVLGVGAYDGGRLIGLAGCSADCEEMWQIGIDVLPEYRGKGIAPALTNRLARAVLEREKVPFYCSAWSNIKSVRNALGSGFRPAWTELTCKTPG